MEEFKMDKYYWKKLDNVATFYASTTTTYNPNIYRLSIRLKEQINKDVLTVALNDTFLTIPSFRVKLRRGFFWYYFETNNDIPIIKEDSNFPSKMINTYDNNYFLFKVTYYEKRISVDFSHILTDGVGALQFLEMLVTEYIKLKHPKKVRQDIVDDVELLSPNEMDIDSFLQYTKMSKIDKKIIEERKIKSYIIKDKNNKNLTNLIIGTISVLELKKITKEKNTTITTYLVAILIYAIYHGYFKYGEDNHPISIAIPVNLRNYFPSYSMNNFFSTIIVSIDAYNNDYTFDDVLKSVSEQMKTELDKDILLKKFRVFVNLQSNIVLRFMPLFIKDILLRNIGRIISDRGSTTSLSNLGIVSVKEEIKDYINKVDMIAYTDSTLPLKVGICSFNDNLSISFSSTINDTEIERIFFTSLVNSGIKVKISASDREV
jgi:NRPS condensation-like uncharacterized protein